jgi:hypothetical protein
MKRHHSFFTAATTLAVATAAIAASPVGELVLAPHKATQKTLNGYSFDVPAGEFASVPTLLVMGPDKVRYSQLALGQFPMRFNIRATQECPGIDWVQNRVPYIYIGDRRWPGESDSKPILGPEGTVYSAEMKVNRDSIEFKPELDPVGRCNSVISRHSDQGQPPAELLKQGFWIRVDGMAHARVAPGCEYNPPKEVGFHEYPTAGQRHVWLPVWINCMPTGYVETHRLPPEPHRTKPEAHRLAGIFRSIELGAVNSPLKHRCPATVVFRGKFQANRAVSGTYRLIGSDGYASPAYPFSLADGAERSVSWQRRVELPPAAGGFTAGDAATWPRRVAGWLQLEVSPSGPDAELRRSERADYEVHCTKPPSPSDTVKSPG